MTFSEEMNTSTLNASTFTLKQGPRPVPGSANTGAMAEGTAAPAVGSVSPPDGATDVPNDNNLKVDPSFSESMDSTMISGPTFELNGPGETQTRGSVDSYLREKGFRPATLEEAGELFAPSIVASGQALTGEGSNISRFGAVIDKTSLSGTISYDAPSRIATFVPMADLASNTLYTATITTGVADMAGNELTGDHVWTFRTGTGLARGSIDLGSADLFAVLAGSTVSNTDGTGTVLNGNLGFSPGPDVVGFPPGQVNGAIYAGGVVVAKARLDLATAFDDARARSTGAISLTGNLGGLTLPPGLYSNPGAVMISGTGANSILTLDAQGNSDAVFIFKAGSMLTVHSDTSVVLAGGAKAANIYWWVGTSATLGTASIFYGNILADESIALEAGATLHGRALTRLGAVTLDSSTVTVPAP